MTTKSLLAMKMVISACIGENKRRGFWSSVHKTKIGIWEWISRQRTTIKHRHRRRWSRSRTSWRVWRLSRTL